MEKPTKVIFRKFKDGDVIALFPTLPGTSNVYTCMSYMRVGQHCPANISVYNGGTVLANESEYAPLAKELESIGYVLDVRKRFSPNDMRARAQQL